MVMTHSVKEVVFLNHLFGDLAIPISNLIPLLVDNQSVITLMENPIFHMHSKHIEVHHHWMCEKVGDGTIQIGKSTRLNSSHQIISYAVFCLKKKKKIHI